MDMLLYVISFDVLSLHLMSLDNMLLHAMSLDNYSWRVTWLTDNSRLPSHPKTVINEFQSTQIRGRWRWKNDENVRKGSKFFSENMLEIFKTISLGDVYIH